MTACSCSLSYRDSLGIPYWLCLLVLTALSGLASYPASGKINAGLSVVDERPALTSVLDADGRIRPGTEGSFSGEGIGLVYDEDGAPRFASPAAVVESSNWYTLSSGLNGTVRAVAVSGSDVYVGGDFINAGGDSNADYIARWDGSSWNALGSGLNGTVRAVVVSGSDVYVGGLFTNAGGNSNADYIARWDGSSWNALGSGLNEVVDAVAVSGSDVYVGGDFINAGGDSNADYIARWDGSSWNALGSGLSDWAGAVTVSGSDVYVGGAFINAGGDSNADYIARWDGSSWNALGSGLDDDVWAVAVSGSDVYVGGWFINAGGNSNADFIARWDGSSWNALGSGLNNTAVAVTVSGSEVYVGGYFTNAGGDSNADYIARWDGSSWNALDSGLDDDVYAVAISGSEVYVGGQFIKTGDATLTLNRIGRYYDTVLPVELVSFRAISDSHDVLLDWQTVSETNNAGFEIQGRALNERATHASTEDWHRLDWVDGHGTTALAHSYTYRVADLGPGRYRFRLKQVDFDGTFAYSAAVEVVVSMIEPFLVEPVYPNPFNPVAELRFAIDRSQRVRVDLYDLLGRRVRALYAGEPASGQMQTVRIDGSGLPSGVYVVRVVGEGFTQIQTVTLLK